MGLLNGQVAIVTGASAGIGRAAATLFAAEGAAVVVGARRAAELQALVDEIHHAGGRAVAVAGDVVDEDHARALVQAAEERFGGLDVALNNAGSLGSLGPLDELTLAGWQATLATNLTSAFLGARHQVPAMRKRGGGSLIFTGSFVGHTAGFPGTAAYAASKAGLIGLTQALATELGPAGLRVNALLPGGTDTAMGRQMNPTPEALSAVASLHALKRLALPEEVAQAALFLASGMASFVTGPALLADGGVSVCRP